MSEVKTCVSYLKQDRASKIHSCTNCGKLFHTTCASFLYLTDMENEKIRACRPCPALLTGPSSHIPRGSSHNSPSIRTRSNSAASTTASSESGRPNSSSLDLILAKLNRLDGLSERFTAVEARLDDISSRLETVPALEARLDDISTRLNAVPQLINRVEQVEAEVAEVRREQHTLAQRLDGMSTAPSASSDPAPAATLQLLKDLERANEELSSRLSSIASATSSNLVIGGLSLPSVADLRKSAFAALKCVYDDLEPRDILSARVLPSRASHATMRDTTVTKAGTSGANSSLEQSSSVVPLTRPPLLIATLASRPLLDTIIGAKARRGKIHTTDIDAALLVEAGCVEPIPPSLVNINEFLPADQYRLRRTVREKSKDKTLDFVSFVRRGQLFVRSKKDHAAAIQINSMKDFEDFLSDSH